MWNVEKKTQRNVIENWIGLQPAQTSMQIKYNGKKCAQYACNCKCICACMCICKSEK